VSLYNNISAKIAPSGIASALSAEGLIGSVKSGLGGGINSLAGTANSAMGGSLLAATVSKIGANMASNAATGLINKYIPATAQNALNIGSSALGSLMQGDLSGAGMKILGSGVLDKLLAGTSGAARQVAYWNTPTPVMGGVSPSEAKQIHDSLRGEKLAHKNWFFIEVSSKLKGDASTRFNMFCTSLDYAPLTISGEKKKIGAASVDVVLASEPVEMRMTTMDNKDGFIKRWFEDHCSAAASSDGTVGVPGRYAVTIKVVHAFISKDSNKGGYENIGLFRPANLEVSLSRQDHGMQELSLTFSQLDTFMKA
jgi:hypothetical protein